MLLLSYVLLSHVLLSCPVGCYAAKVTIKSREVTRHAKSPDTLLSDRATVSACSYVDMMEGALMNLPGDTNTSVTLLENLVHGLVWCTNKVRSAPPPRSRSGAALCLGCCSQSPACAITRRLRTLAGSAHAARQRPCGGRLPRFDAEPAALFQLRVMADEWDA